MALGEHLEELRSRLIRAVIGLLLGAILCYAFSDYVLGLLMWPVFATLRAHGLPATLSYLTPAEAFLTDLKVSFIVGFILSAPYSLTQIWGFVAAGLYPRERKWIRRFVPVSIALFFTGAGFLLLVATPLLLDFLVSYRQDLPDLERYIPTSRLVPGLQSPPPPVPSDQIHWPTSQPIVELPGDPQDPPAGFLWYNRTANEVRIQFDQHTYTLAHLTDVTRHNKIEPMFRISEYVIFVLQLAAAFGIGFQVPVVVAFVATLGIATASQMSQARRYVWFGMAIVAAVVTPPDITSMLFLLGPMAVLYEIGLLAARLIEREARNKTANE